MATVATADWLRVCGDDVLLRVRVQPRASRNRLDAIEAGRLRLRVAAPPVEGGANRALVELLAAALGIARSRLSIERGAGARNKDVRIAGAARVASELRTQVFEALASRP